MNLIWFLSPLRNLETPLFPSCLSVWCGLRSLERLKDPKFINISIRGYVRRCFRGSHFFFIRLLSSVTRRLSLRVKFMYGRSFAKRSPVSSVGQKQRILLSFMLLRYRHALLIVFDCIVSCGQAFLQNLCS